jgi:hypothetical protein
MVLWMFMVLTMWLINQLGHLEGPTFDIAITQPYLSHTANEIGDLVSAPNRQDSHEGRWWSSDA